MTSVQESITQPATPHRASARFAITGTDLAPCSALFERQWPDLSVDYLAAESLSSWRSSAPIVLFVERPELCLAAHLACGRELTDVLQAWEKSARQILRRLQSDPATFFVVDIEEATEEPVELWRALTSILPELPAPLHASASPYQLDPVWLALANQCLEERPDLIMLADELSISCVVLSTARRSRPSLTASIEAYKDRISHQEAALERTGVTERTLAATQLQLATLTAAMQEQELSLQRLNTSTTARLSELKEEYASRERALHTEIKQYDIENGRLKKELEVERARVEATLQEVQELVIRQSQFEELTRQNQEQTLSLLADPPNEVAATLKADNSLLSEQLVTYDLQVRVITHAWAEMSERVDSYDERQTSLLASLKSATTDLQFARHQLNELKRELGESQTYADFLLSQLQAQQAICTDANKPSESSRSEPFVARVREMEIVGEVDSGRHRHLDLILHNLTLGPEAHVELPLRLVEHHARPGLVMFRSPTLASPVSSWITSGTEGEREYLLAVPQDSSSREYLLSLGTSDWFRLVGLTNLIVQHLLRNQSAPLQGWTRVASRLVHLFAELPPRVRYDSIRASTTSSSERLVVLVKATFGTREFGDVELLMTADGQAIDWQLPGGTSCVPSSCWPAADALAPWRLPVGNTISTTEKRDAWASMGSANQELVLGLLDALRTESVIGPKAVAWRNEARWTLFRVQTAKFVRRVIRRIAKSRSRCTT